MHRLKVIAVFVLVMVGDLLMVVVQWLAAVWHWVVQCWLYANERQAK